MPHEDLLTAEEFESRYGPEATAAAKRAGAEFAPVVLWSSLHHRILADGSIEERRHDGDFWRQPMWPIHPALEELARIKMAEHRARKAGGDWAERAAIEWIMRDQRSTRTNDAHDLTSIIRKHAPAGEPAPGGAA